jgi:nucleotide-binding universal stress UspA family protein
MSETIILVPLDGSEQALAALPVAKVLAEIERAAVHILHVAERAPAGAEWSSLLGREALALDSFTIDARIGKPAAEILDVAARIKPRFIVMCKHSGATRGKMLGSTAMEVVRNSPCPVVLVPPERGSTPWHLHHVMVPHDGTPTTSAALPPAAELAERGRAELLVAHVTGIGAAPAEPGSLTTPRYVDAPQHEWPAWTSEFIKRLACVCPLGSVHVRMLLAHGDTAAEILRFAGTQSTDIIALAWRGKWEAPRAAILKDIVREAHCPIMVVRA